MCVLFVVCRLFVAGCSSLLFVCCLSCVVCCLVCVGCPLLFLFSARPYMFVTSRLLCVVRMVRVADCPLCAVRCLLFG